MEEQSNIGSSQSKQILDYLHFYLITHFSVLQVRKTLNARPKTANMKTTDSATNFMNAWTALRR